MARVFMVFMVRSNTAMSRVIRNLGTDSWDTGSPCPTPAGNRGGRSRRPPSARAGVRAGLAGFRFPPGVRLEAERQGVEEEERLARPAPPALVHVDRPLDGV